MAATTCIQREYIEAIEQGRWEEVPAAYLRGYISLVAQATGMNIEKVQIEFDRLHKSPDDRSHAEIDDLRPLAGRNDRVGDTRAKIRSNWIRPILENRRFSYIVLLLVLAAALMVRQILFKPGIKSTTELLPFTSAQCYVAQTTHGPFTELNLIGPAGGGKEKSRALYFIGVAPGWIAIPTDGDSLVQLYHDFHDTLHVRFQDTLTVLSSPAGSLSGYHSDFSPLPTESMDGDTAIFRYPIMQDLHTPSPAPIPVVS